MRDQRLTFTIHSPKVLIVKVKLGNIFMPVESAPATTLPAMHITEDTFHYAIEIRH